MNQNRNAGISFCRTEYGVVYLGGNSVACDEFPELDRAVGGIGEHIVFNTYQSVVKCAVEFKVGAGVVEKAAVPEIQPGRTVFRILFGIDRFDGEFRRSNHFDRSVVVEKFAVIQGHIGNSAIAAGDDGQRVTGHVAELDIVHVVPAAGGEDRNFAGNVVKCAV